MAKLNLRHFKKIQEDEHTAVMQHPHGHHIVISKHILSPDMQKQLASLPVHKADGGDEEVSAATEPGPRPSGEEMPNPKPSGPTADEAQAMEAEKQRTQEPARNTAIEQAQLPPEPEQQKMAPFIPPKGADISDIQKGVREQIGGAYTTAQGIEKAENERAQYAANNATQLQNAQADFDRRRSGLDQDLTHALDDYKAGHIDPRHYWESKSTGSKVATAIGLILGGAGAGATRGPNIALDFLNKQIDRDINAQQADLGKRATVLEANFKRYGNLQDATNMTKAFQQSILASQLEQSAAHATTAQAKGAAMQAAGQYRIQAQGLLHQTAMNQYMLQSMQQQGGGSDNPAAKLNLAVRSGAIPGNMASEAFKQLKDAGDHATASKTVLDTFNEANKATTIGGAAASPRIYAASRDKLKTSLMPLLRLTEGRVNEVSIENAAKAYTPRAGDSDSVRASKLRGLQAFVKQAGSFPLLDLVGIKPQGAEMGPSTKFKAKYTGPG